MNTQHSESRIVFLKDNEWSVIDGQPCRVRHFGTLGSYIDTNGKIHSFDKTMPYALADIECNTLGKNITGYITHKIDFQHLWVAFKERTVKEDEEVIIFWTTKHYKVHSWIGRKLYSAFMPKLWVMICRKGAFEIMADPNYKPELTGEARWNAEKPIIQWKPEVMD